MSEIATEDNLSLSLLIHLLVSQIVTEDNLSLSLLVSQMVSEENLSLSFLIHLMVTVLKQLMQGWSTSAKQRN